MSRVGSGKRPDRGRTALLATSCALAVLGLGAVAAGVVDARSDDGRSPASPPTSAPAVDPTAPRTFPAAPAEPDGDAAGTVDGTDGAAGPVTDLVDAAWVASTAATTGVPERALAAYAGASLAVASSAPGCGLGWNTLAAIGAVESDHGRIGGAVVGADGRALPRILGVPLDGDGVAAVADTDGGELDGDTTWDRAVGPMQFVPATWREHAADGDGDGTPDPDSIDDAALSAATYLCATGGVLTEPTAWISAVTAYNADVAYVNQVADEAERIGAAAGR
ncbi:lytic murein transglycosylase [Nocardioides sp. CPCC 205120]|uniref:lytic murein transglycosylase n=1 Tax=Nocardioides sp. CPCC 205120 TaxID=3406462 RepID=UPI003B500735